MHYTLTHLHAGECVCVCACVRVWYSMWWFTAPQKEYLEQTIKKKDHKKKGVSVSDHARVPVLPPRTLTRDYTPTQSSLTMHNKNQKCK
jgi:hypothetical protein